MKILVVDDERLLVKGIKFNLENDGYSVDGAYDGEEGLDFALTGIYDLIILDVMMPKMDGFELAEAIRSEDKQIPILFMSAKDDKPSKLLGYKIGIDDYVVKPFDIDELIMKVNALLRRASIETDKKIVVGNLTMDTEEHTAYINGEEISLTVREFELLFKLLSYPKKTFTRSALMEEFWDYDSSATSRTVDVYMAKLREKTAECDGFDILTVHGLGYKAVLK